MTKRPTIIDFVNTYVDKYQDATFLREKVDGVWTETSFKQTREEAKIIGAGFLALGLRSPSFPKVATFGSSRNWASSTRVR